MLGSSPEPPISSTIWLGNSFVRKLPPGCFRHAYCYSWSGLSTVLLNNIFSIHVYSWSSWLASRALMQGYSQWTSGRLEQLSNNSNHPSYCCNEVIEENRCVPCVTAIDSIAFIHLGPSYYICNKLAHLSIRFFFFFHVQLADSLKFRNGLLLCGISK